MPVGLTWRYDYYRYRSLKACVCCGDATNLQGNVYYARRALRIHLWRWSNFIVWDDTSSASYNMFSNDGHYSLDRIWAIVVEFSLAFKVMVTGQSAD
jgi:hypothetical protein